jgi:hypothetical protein
MRIKRGDGNGGDPVRSPSGGQPYVRRLATSSGSRWMKQKGRPGENGCFRLFSSGPSGKRQVFSLIIPNFYLCMRPDFNGAHMQYSAHLLRHTRLIIGRNIHHHRSKKKIPLHRLAKLTSLSEHLIDHYELGKNEIRLDHLLRIACAINVGLKDLLRDDDQRTQD